MTARHLGLWALLIILTACTGAERRDTAPIDPDAALRPALARLIPYDFGDRTASAIKWLDNHAVANPRKDTGRRARAWILRARIDWFTAAYTEPEHAARLTRLIALMDNLGIDHGGHVDQTTLQATTRALERQAQGIATDPAHADFAQETLQFLALTHHLDQSAPYFDAINTLRRATPPPGAMSAQPNALIVALVDLHTDLTQLPTLPPDRHPQALARMAAFPCPDALIAFSTAPLETRRARLKPCPWDAQDTPQGVDNTLMHHVLDDIAQLVQQGRRVLASDHPIVEHQRASIETWLTALEKHRFTLALPESKTILQSDPDLALTAIPYAAHPGVTPLLILHTQKTTRVATHPIATLKGDTHTPAQATPKLAPWQYPGTVTNDLDAEIDKILTPLAEDLGLKPGADHFVPAIAIDATTEVQQIVKIAALLMNKGFGAVDLIVSDPTLDRAGVIRFTLVAAPSKESVSLLLTPTQSTVSRDKDRAKLGDPAQTPGTLYVALGQWATGRFDRSIPALAVQAEPGVSWGQTAAAIDAARFWRTADLSAPIKEIMASEIAGDDAPMVLVGSFELVVEGDTARP